jgi:hypothetical protein
MRPAAYLIFAATALLQAHAQPYAPPRTPDGRPDLQGTWTNSSITMLERTNPSFSLILSPEQVRTLEAQRFQMERAQNAPSDAEAGAPQDRNTAAGYNAFWLDRGKSVAVVNGTARSSWITEPASGKMPISDAGQALIAAILSKRNEDGPEGLNPADRCLVASRGSGGPPMLNNIYNNTYLIVQTNDHVMINVEMMHDARIIRMGEAHKPGELKQWLGDSVGEWDGDTLVVKTRNWHPLHGGYEPVFLSEQATVTERFARTGPDELTYSFEVDDPGFYSQTWKGEMVFTTSPGDIYEFACHEGNHALEGILRGARRHGRP